MTSKLEPVYYNPNKLLSYNRILNFVIGARGIGKTYGYKKYVINRFIKTGKQFIYVRRFKEELKKVKNFFKAVAQEFPNHEFVVKGKEFYIDGKICGYAMSLTSWQSEKSNEYPMVETMLFDEFILEKDFKHYLPNEVESLLNFMDTVFRTRDDVRCICMSNSVTLINPYFVYFGLQPNASKRYNAYESIVVEIPESYDFGEFRKTTRFGKLIDGTNYSEMAIENKFVNDSDTFLLKRTKNSKFVFSVLYKGHTMGVWKDLGEGLYFLSTSHDPSTKWKYCLTAEELNEGIILAKNWKDSYHLSALVKVFKNGQLRFDNQLTRTVGYEMFKKMSIY